ncbi:hypothetical protein [Paracraurococcus lichenis]|uniref:STAS/SEC14 domain-containing protein n=1 Tax=Paracraurococcus lichenis TaxID=3064888 RepID=A0ABT9E2F6_9PROT|nr:hypothetical protein [Paracraurococcus sp. LOR1-02]MDO9710326.1 hypothetical protein [Paracraurococcus sp. LOR1-02]
MALSLILHDLTGLAPEDEKRFFEAIFQVAPEHWPMDRRTTLVVTGVSPTYLRDHLVRAVPAAARPGLRLVVTHVPADAAWHALPPEGEAWLREALADN